MSDQLTTNNQALVALHDEVAARLDSLRAQTVETVRHGAQLGCALHEARRRHMQDFWSWLQDLHPDVRHDVIRFAFKSHSFVQRNPDLPEASELGFALAAPQPEQDTTDNPAPQRRDAGTVAAVTTHAMKLQQSLNRLTQSNLDDWDPVVRRSVRETLRPLVEVWKKLA